MASETNEHLALIGYYRLHPTDAEAFRALAAASVAPTRAKDGCLHYAFAEDVKEPGLFHVAEGWRDREALDAHLASPDFAETLRQAGELNISERQVTTFTASNGQSLW
ncbi:antibiotic biosynthesis monooxygenase [Sagittula sp. NFXS13]|uniref:putative quinol monooxygenase n=1 Tax=Sagittula sp. NFXS13 TaxID=2819095 RepID=UPI0032DF8C1A